MAIRILSLLMLFTLSTVSLYGGERITTFQIGAKPPPEVLAHLDLKAVVSEFLDPMDTGLGKSLGFLLWRETLTAISDQAGAGVILAHTPNDSRLTDMLEQDYHRAALEIAASQRGRMVLWGAVTEEGGRVFVATYLSLLTADGRSDLQIEVAPELSAPHTFSQGPAPSGASRTHLLQPALKAVIPRTLYNFALVDLTRAELFERPIITRGTTNVRAGPDERAEKIAQVSGATRLQAVDMQDAWFKVRLDDGRTGYVFNALVNVPPRTVDADRRDIINLRAGPGTDFAVLRRGTLRGSFRVLDMRYRPEQGLWYEIADGEKTVWVYAELVRPRFSIPAVHFLAGLYRFYGHRYRDAAREFAQFIDTPGVDEINVNLASANQLLGASLLAANPMHASAQSYEAFSNAVRYTPYDPAAYALRAIASLERGTAVEDLARALKLDDRDVETRNLVAALTAIASKRARPRLADFLNLDQQAHEYEALSARYRIPPAVR